MTASLAAPTAPAFLSALASPGARVEGVEILDVGKIVLPSGRIVACDGLVLDPRAVLATAVPAGQYPLFIGSNDIGYAWAMIRVTNDVVATWHADAVTKEGPRGYAVDSGIGCFIDVKGALAVELAENQMSDAIAREIGARGIAASDSDAWHAAFDEIRSKRKDVRLAGRLQKELDSTGIASAVIDETSGANIVAFATGMGDGVYATWIGKSAAGVVACVVTDFQLSDLEADDAVPLLGGGLGGGGLAAGGLAALLGALSKPAAAAEAAVPEVNASEHIAKLFSMLVTRGKIELARGESLSKLAKRATPVVKKGPAKFYAWLLDQPEVDEVFMDEEELEQILEAW